MSTSRNGVDWSTVVPLHLSSTNWDQAIPPETDKGNRPLPHGHTAPQPPTGPDLGPTRDEAGMMKEGGVGRSPEKYCERPAKPDLVSQKRASQARYVDR